MLAGAVPRQRRVSSDEATLNEAVDAQMQEVANANIGDTEEEKAEGENNEDEGVQIVLHDLEVMEHVIARRQNKLRTELSEKFSGTSDILFVDLMVFQTVIGGVVMLNAILLGIEVDYDLGTAGFVLNSVFASVYVLEAGSKIFSYGLKKYFRHGSNQLDFVLAVLCALDTWVLPFVQEGNQAGLKSFVITRLARAVRVVRIVRSLQLFKELWLLLNGLIQACMALIWVFVLILLVIYSFSIIMTYVVGHDCGADGHFAHWDMCEEAYGDLPRSMLTLFALMTLDMETLRPVAGGSPGVFFVMLVFMMLTSFGLLNIIMGVIVEQVLLSSADNEEKIKQEKQRRQQAELQLLLGIFREADSDGSGYVTLDEFLEICKRQDVRNMFEDLGMPVSRKNLAQRLFEVLDIQNNGHLDIDVFLERTRSLTKEGKQLQHDQTLLLMDVRHLNRRLTRAEQGLNEKMCSIQSEQKDISAKLVQIIEALSLEEGPIRKM